MELVPTSELSAVNVLLASIGEAPVNSLAVPGFEDASIAVDTLRQTARSVLTPGWYFNTDTARSFTPDGSGEVVLPDTVLRARASPGESRRLVPREGKLYDLTNNTYTFDPADPPTLSVTHFFDYETLPEAARAYIAVKAARIFQANQMGSGTLYQFSRENEIEAYSALVKDEDEFNPGNMFNDSADVSGVWREAG